MVENGVECYFKRQVILHFETRGINGGFETHDILMRFLNSWYLTGVVKDFS